MRQVTRQISQAFKAGNPRTVGNTTTDGNRIQLHGNTIAEKIHPESTTGAAGKRIRVTLAGWNTPTTRERVNGLFTTLRIPARIYQHNFAAYLSHNGQEFEIDPSEWLYF